MLVELRIRDFAIIERVALPCAPGFNVLSGETGAGKSIIVGALSLLIGERAAADSIRTGAERAVVEGVFDLRERADLAAQLDARGIDVTGGEVILKREIASARSRAWINGSPVTAGVLADIGRALINIHGQHEAQSLMDPAAQRRILDAFAGSAAAAAAVRTQFDRVSALDAARAQRNRERADASKREDWLRHVVRELADARLRVGEDDELSDEMRRLAHAEELRALSAEASSALDGEHDALVPRLGAVQRALHALQRIDPTLERLQEPFDTAYYQLQELARELSAYADAIDADPSRLADVQARRDLIHRLSRKYGGSEAAALAQLDEARRELALLDVAADGADDLDRDAAAARAELEALAADLTARRTRAARAFAAAVREQFPALGLADGVFEASLQPLPDIGPDGAEDVEFSVALNVGHAARPLARVASGGELSRVMLAITTILARHDHVPTLIFDEVDAGIGGTVALQVGDAMRRVAEFHQVFAITHLPQIAARAHHHVVVEKSADGGVTTADTRIVEAEARVVELARMLGGDPASDVSREHARELLAGAARPTAPTAARTRGAKSGRRS